MFGFAKRHATTLAVVSLLSIHAGLLAYGSYIHSPTLDEPGHLVAGISYWKSGHFDVYCVNPPLVRLVAAAPVVIAGCRTEWQHYSNHPGSRPEFILGDDFLAANGERSCWLMTLARWACIPFSLLGGYVCFRWAKSLYGAAAGLLSLTLWCFSPNIIAHAQLITCDAAAASLGVTACYAFWRWLKSPTWWHVIVGGILLGTAELAKTTLLVLYPVFLVAWLTCRWPQIHMAVRASLRELGMLLAGGIISIWALNAAYCFDGTFTALRDFKFMSASLGVPDNNGKVSPNGSNRFAKSWIAGMPVPLPRDYLIGIDLQRRDFETNFGETSYLNDRFSSHGWWYFYLYALAIKVPLGSWLLMCMAATRRLWRCRERRSDDAAGNHECGWRDELVLLLPALAVIALVSSQTAFSEHMRYVLPAFPLMMVWIARVVPACGARHKIPTMLVVGALAWSVASSMLVYPHCLSYFNELAGGPSGGSAHLIGSNIDWGQDLILLKNWLNGHPEAKPLHLAYYGPGDPRDFGIEYTWPGSQAKGAAVLEPGWYAVSVSFFRGYEWIVHTGDGGFRRLRRDELNGLRLLRPTARIGYSILIYNSTNPGRPLLPGACQALSLPGPLKSVSVAPR